MDLEFLQMQMVKFTKEIIKIISEMDMANIIMKMAIDMKGNI